MASQTTSSKRPRLSLKIKTTDDPTGRAVRAFPVDPKDPTTFNTLSNAYVTAIERSAAPQAEPMTAINTLQAFSLVTPVEHKDPKMRVVTPFIASYPETPLTATSSSPGSFEVDVPNTMTATPPLSAAPQEQQNSKIFTFSPVHTAGKPNLPSVALPLDGEPPRPRPASMNRIAAHALDAPYTHSHSLHSILRNSPLPPRTAIPPQSPRRQSMRLLEKAAKKVEYNSPLTEDIITNKYVKSHIDLLTEGISPNSPALNSASPQDIRDWAMSFAPNEIRDGGQTPGPFETARRMIAGGDSASSSSPSASTSTGKRKRREKKRRWVWTIGQDEGEDNDIGGAEAALRAAARARKEDGTDMPTTLAQEITYLETPTETPTPSIESADSCSEAPDVEMSDTSSVVSVDRGLTPSDSELDMKTPTGPHKNSGPPERRRSRSISRPKGDTPIPGSNRDTPIPELNRDTPGPTAMRKTPVPDTKRDTPIPELATSRDVSVDPGAAA